MEGVVVTRRDRHDRGIRGPLLPPQLPAYRTRTGKFDDQVITVVQHLETSWGAELAGVEFAVEEVPVLTPVASEVPLGRLYPAEASQPARIVVYRRPLEMRALDAADLEDLVFDVVVEQVAHHLGIEPSEVDPTYYGDL